MRKVFTLLLMILMAFSSYALSQQKYLSFFSAYAIQEANTASGINISQEEKDAVLWTNLVRIEPQNFYKMLIAYVQANTQHSLSNSYVQSLLMDLKNTNPMHPLEVSSLLNKNANSHAIYSQKTKRMGHENFEKRAQIAFRENYKSYGENCVYGIYDALDAVVNLLIDEGVPDLGHRKIILSDKYNEIGVAMTPFYSNKSKVLVQQFGNQPNKMIKEPIIQPTPLASVSNVAQAPSMPSTVKRMYINGKYVLVDTAKYYTPSEYKRYIQQAQQIKSKQ